MGKPVNSDVKRAETFPLRTKVNKEVIDNFKGYCSYYGYPMNIMIETFMIQYSNGKFNIDDCDISKWENDKAELDTLSTTFNKDVYTNFKNTCKANGYYVKHVLTSFMEKFSTGNFVLEYVDVSKEN